MSWAGILLGGATTLPAEGSGFTLGGEFSFGHLWELTYVGGVVDTLYDWGRDGGRTMIGPMVGWSVVGIDGGYLVEYGEGPTLHGGAVRLFFTIGVVALYTRVGILSNGTDFVEYGALLKIPLLLDARFPERPRPPPPEPTEEP